jgi:hypothetical protein
MLCICYIGVWKKKLQDLRCIVLIKWAKMSQSTYRSPNVILAQLRNCHVELIERLSWKNIRKYIGQYRHTTESKHTPLDSIIVGCRDIFELNCSISSKWAIFAFSEQYVQRPVPSDIWIIFVLSLQQTLHVVSTHFNTTFSSSSHKKCVLFQKFRVLVEFPNMSSLLGAEILLSHWSGMNTPKS